VIEAGRRSIGWPSLDHGTRADEGTPAEAQGGIATSCVRTGPGLDADAIEAQQFTGLTSSWATELVATVPTAWPARPRRGPETCARTGESEEFSLGPATLEDAYVALVGATSVPQHTGGDRCPALRSYRLLVIWQARRMRMFLPLGIVVQALFGLWDRSRLSPALPTDGSDHHPLSGNWRPGHRP